MEVIRHNTIGEHSHRNALTGPIEQVNEGIIVCCFSKYFLAAIAAIDDMVANAADRSSRSSWHDPLLPQWGSLGKEK